MADPEPTDLGQGDDPVRRGLVEWYGVEDLDDLEDKLEPPEFEEAVDRLDPEMTRRRLVLLGAGASADAGLPTAPELDEELGGRHLPLYAKLRRALDKDVERGAQLLELLASSSPLSDGFVRLRMLQFLAGRSGQANQVPTVAENELSEIKKHIRSRFWLPDDTRSVERCSYLRPLVQAQTGGTIATLNYDNVLERVGGSLDLGSGWPDDEVDVPYQHPFRVRVLPLHGYLGWELRKDPGQELTKVVCAGKDQDPSDLSYPYEPGIIFGASNKLRHFGPFLRLLEALRQALEQARTVVTIGYSWRDPHINDMLRAWAARGHEIARARVDHIEGPPSWRLIVGTGPSGGELPPLANRIRTHHSPFIRVTPVRGTANETVEQLFAPGQELSAPHLGAYRKFWCSS